MRAIGAGAVVGLAVALTLIAISSSMQHVSFSAQRGSPASMETPVPPQVAQQPLLGTPSQPPQPVDRLPQPPRDSRPQPPPRGRAAVGPLGPPPASVTLVFGTAAMSDYVFNWLWHARRLGAALKPYAVVALDTELLRACAAWGEPALDARALLSEPALGSEAAAALAAIEASYVRNAPRAFRQLGYLKALSTARLLALGYDVLLSDADAVFMADPWPWIGRVGVPPAEDAGWLSSADVLSTNDYPDLRRDGKPDSVYNTGVTFFRASSGRARVFVLEWANRTLSSGVIGNDQTEFNRLLRNRYVDGDGCHTPACLAPDPGAFVPAYAEFDGPGCGGGGGADGAADAPTGARAVGVGASGGGGVCELSGRCRWVSEPTVLDNHSGLLAVPLRAASAEWHECLRKQESKRRLARHRARQAYWMWGGRVRFGLLPMERFEQGSTFFVQRLHARRGVAPVHVHVTYAMGGDDGKRWRLRGAGLWQQQPPPTGAATVAAGGSASRGGLLRLSGLEGLIVRLIDRMMLPPAVFACHGDDQPSALFAAETSGGDNAGRDRCYHPRELVPTTTVDFEHALDPAAPHLAVTLLSRLVLRNAFALGFALNRTVVLPRLWALCERHWWQLVDCRIPGIEGMPMPYEAPLDLLFDLDRWKHIRRLELIEPAAPDVVAAEAAGPRLTQTLELTAPGAGNALPEPSTPQQGGHSPAADHARTALRLRHGSTFDGAARAISADLLAAVGASRPLLSISAASLLRFSPCGFDSAAEGATFGRHVLAHTFSGQYSYCGEERNPHVEALLTEARAKKLPEEPVLIARRNCTGQPANAFNKPKVDLGAAALGFRAAAGGRCGAAAGGESDGVEAAMQEALRLVRQRAGP